MPSYYAMDVDKSALTGKAAVAAALADYLMLSDASDSGKLKKATVQSVIDLVTAGTMPAYVSVDLTPGTNVTSTLQAAITAAGSGSHVAILEPGVYDLTPAGATATANTSYCIDLRPINGGSLTIGPGVVFRLAPDTMSGSSNFVHLFWFDKSDGTLIIGGQGTIDGNSTNQSGWNGGYKQIDGSVGISISCTDGAKGFKSVLVHGLTVKNCFANAIYAAGVTATSHRGGTLIADSVTWQKCGEGLEAHEIEDMRVFNCTCLVDQWGRGDFLEGVNMRMLVVDNYTTKFPDEGCQISITRSGSTATVTHPQHGLVNGDSVKISDCDQAEYNGVKSITVVSATSYTFAVSGSPATPATGKRNLLGPAGAGIDFGGTETVILSNLSLRAVNVATEGILTNWAGGDRWCKNVLINGIYCEGTTGAAVLCSEGYTEIHNATFVNCSLSVLYRGKDTSYPAAGRLVGGHFINTAGPLFWGATDVEWVNVDLTCTSQCIGFDEHATHTGTPRAKFRDCKMRSTQSYGIYMTCLNGAKYKPICSFVGGEFHSHYAGQMYGADTGSAQLDFSGIEFDRVLLESADQRPGSLATKKINALLGTAQQVLTVPVHHRLVTRKVTARVVALDGTPGNVVIDLGVAADSDLILDGTAITPTAVGQTFDLTSMLVAGHVGPTSTITPGSPATLGLTAVSVTMQTTASAVSRCDLEIVIEGDYVPAGLTPDLTAIANFRAWYKTTGQLWQNTAKTTAANAAGHAVRVWAPSAGTGPDISAPADGNRPTIGAAGGLIGNGTDRYMTSANIDLSASYTVLAKVKTASTNSAKAYMGASVGADAFALRSNDAALDFYCNDDAAATVMATEYSVFVVIGWSVQSSNGNTTLWRPDGSTVSGNGSSGETSLSATSVLSILSGYGGSTAPAAAETPIYDLVIIDRIITAAEYLAVREQLLT